MLISKIRSRSLDNRCQRECCLQPLLLIKRIIAGSLLCSCTKLARRRRVFMDRLLSSSAPRARSPLLNFMPRSKSVLLLFVCLCASLSARAQQHNPSVAAGDNTPRIHHSFPFQTMWDDAVLTSVKSKKPTAAFDLDLIDTESIRVAKTVMGSPKLQTFLRKNFEVALNDFASD